MRRRRREPGSARSPPPNATHAHDGTASPDHGAASPHYGAASPHHGTRPGASRPGANRHKPTTAEDGSCTTNHQWDGSQCVLIHSGDEGSCTTNYEWDDSECVLVFQDPNNPNCGELTYDPVSRLCVGSTSDCQAEQGCESPTDPERERACPDPRQFWRDGRCQVKGPEDDPDRSQNCPAGQVFYSQFGCADPCPNDGTLVNGACVSYQSPGTNPTGTNPPPLTPPPCVALQVPAGRPSCIPTAPPGPTRAARSSTRCPTRGPLRSHPNATTTGHPTPAAPPNATWAPSRPWPAGLSGILCIGRDLRVRSWVLWTGKDHVDD